MSAQQPKIYTYFALAIILFLFGKIAESIFDVDYTETQDVRTIQNAIWKKELQLQTSLNIFNSIDFENKQTVWAIMDSLSNSDYHYYLFKDSTPIAWSTDAIPIHNFNPNQSTNSFKKFPNGWHLVSTHQTGQHQIVALCLIKEEYTYQNKFLSNEFSKDISLNHRPEISLAKSSNASHHIVDLDKKYLFSIEFNPFDYHIASPSILFLLINLISILLLLIAGSKLLIKYNSWKNSNYLFLISIIYLFLIYLFFQHWAIPEDFYYTALFSPSTFAVSDWLPSLGSLVFFGLLLLYWSFWFFKYYKKPRALEKIHNDRKSYYLTISVAIFLILCLFLFTNDLIYMLVRNSSQASILFNIEDLNEIAILKIFILVLLFLSVSVILEKLIISFKKDLSYLGFSIISCLGFLILWGISLISDFDIYIGSLAFFLFISGILYTAKRNTKNSITYSTFVIIIFFISAYNVFFLYHYNVEKEVRNRELLIENLSFKLLREADPIAEMYLEDIEARIFEDEILLNLLQQNQINEGLIQDHLKKNYFHGYWQRYEMQVTACWPEVDLVMQQDQSTMNCYTYFEDMQFNYGQSIPNCDHFHFLDNDNGQVSYFGKTCFFRGDDKFETTLFFEINSKPTFSGLGYPELLTNEQEQVNSSILKNYSFAKYLDGNLVKQFGNHRYPINNSKYRSTLLEKNFQKDDEMTHLVYTPNEDTIIVLSRHKIKLFHVLMAFSTFFILFFLLATAVVISSKIKQDRHILNFTIQERIQIAFVGLMIMILVVMGASSVYYSIYQFKQKNNQMLSQRIKSVLQEMEQKIVNEPILDYEMQEYLQYLLQKFSNVFYSDINLYNLDGQLLATSRPELYQKGLTGRMMNPQAFIELAHERKTEYIHEESIGSLNFTSAYLPIYNYENQVLAYLNLPYFVGNNELKSEVSSLIVAVVNAYLLFILFSIGLAVIISRRITRPLMLIQDRLAQIRLGQQNKKIGYKGTDEIGGLVKEYNRMVDEISESAEKLAKSEREMAWREMAKQIAHEIKNPLTPMKLSVQYLLRAWDEQQDFESYLKRVSTTLIEQIDQLHVIANEFSNFAKMPQANRKKVKIVDKLESVLSLFEKSKKDIHFHLEVEDRDLTIFADNDQLISVFNNVIKNAVQAIPRDQSGNINITVQKKSPNVLLTFSDNGRGMDSETIKKIFMPNFTTKSSGMGLGLSIVKNIVKNSGGEIWFETTQFIGTSFYIEFPIYEGA